MAMRLLPRADFVRMGPFLQIRLFKARLISLPPVLDEPFLQFAKGSADAKPILSMWSRFASSFNRALISSGRILPPPPAFHP